MSLYFTLPIFKCPSTKKKELANSLRKTPPLTDYIVNVENRAKQTIKATEGVQFRLILRWCLIGVTLTNIAAHFTHVHRLEPPAHDSYETEIARLARVNPEVLEIQQKSGLNREDMEASMAQLKLLREKVYLDYVRRRRGKGEHKTRTCCRFFPPRPRRRTLYKLSIYRSQPCAMRGRRRTERRASWAPTPIAVLPSIRYKPFVA